MAQSRRHAVAMACTIAVLGVGSAALAQPRSAPALLVAQAAAPRLMAGSEADFVAITAWIRRTGHAATIAGALGKVLGLGEGAPVQMTAVSFETPQKAGVYIGVVPDRPEVVMARKDPAWQVVWLLKDGEILRTAYTGEYSTSLVADNTYSDWAAKIAAFFLTKAGEPASGR